MLFWFRVRFCSGPGLREMPASPKEVFEGPLVCFFCSFQGVAFNGFVLQDSWYMGFCQNVLDILLDEKPHDPNFM